MRIGGEGLAGGFMAKGESGLKRLFDRRDVAIVEVEGIHPAGFQCLDGRELRLGDGEQEGLNSGVGSEDLHDGENLTRNRPPVNLIRNRNRTFHESANLPKAPRLCDTFAIGAFRLTAPPCRSSWTPRMKSRTPWQSPPRFPESRQAARHDGRRLPEAPAVRRKRSTATNTTTISVTRGNTTKASWFFAPSAITTATNNTKNESKNKDIVE